MPSININPIGTVTIQGSSMPFGGQIYSLSYKIGFGPNPSEMKFNIISSSGLYNISQANLSYSNVYTIQIGTNTFKMYLVGYNIEQTEQGYMLQVEFNDTSTPYLDCLNVLANGKYYLQGFYNSPYVIPLGSAYNKYKIYDANGVYQIIYEPEIPNNTYIYVDVPEIYYTAQQLQLALAAYVPCDQSVANILNNPNFVNYKMNYWGLLRSVLQQVGQDLAFNFFWNENEQLQFIDLSKPITINFQNASNSIRNSESTTIKGTYAFGAASFYGRDGEHIQAVDLQNFSVFTYPFKADVNFGLPLDPSSNGQPYWPELIQWAQIGIQAFTFAFVSRLITSSFVPLGFYSDSDDSSGAAWNFTNYYANLYSTYTQDVQGFIADIATSLGIAAIENNALTSTTTYVDNNGQQFFASQFLEIVSIFGNNVKETIEYWYKKYRAFGSSNGAVYYTPMDQNRGTLYSKQKGDFHWYTGSTLVSATNIRDWFPNQGNLTLDQLFNLSNQSSLAPTSPYAINGLNPIQSSTSASFGWLVGCLAKPDDATYNVGNAPTIISQLGLINDHIQSPQNIFSNNADYTFSYINYPNAASTIQQLLGSITPPTVNNPLTIQITNAFPSFTYYPRQMDILFTGPAAGLNVNKVIIDMQNIDDTLLATIAATTAGPNSYPLTTAAAAQEAHALFAQNILNYGQTSPLQEQSFTIPGVNIPNITIAQGLQSIEITDSKDGVFTSIVIGNRIAQPFTFSIIRERLDNDIFVKQPWLNTFIKIGPTSFGTNDIV